MNIILLRPDQLTTRHEQASAGIEPAPDKNQLILLDERQSKHCTDILKLKPGNTIQTGLINHNLGHAVYDSIDSETSRALIKLKLNELNLKPPKASQIQLYLALPRPKMLRRILRTVAECGVKQLTLFNSSKVEKSYWQTPSLEKKKAEQYFIEGLEQSKDTRLPELHIEKLFRPFIEDKVCKLTDQNSAWVAHPYDEDNKLQDIKQSLDKAKAANTPLHLFIGPEGGFSEFEINLLQKNGVYSFKAGERIFRTETFVSWILGAIDS